MPSTRTRNRLSVDLPPDVYARYQALEETTIAPGRSRKQDFVKHLLSLAEDSTLPASDDTSPTIVESPDVSPDTFLHLLDCSPAEREEIAHALTVPYTDFWQMAKAGLLREVRIRNTSALKLATLDLSSSDVSKNRVRGSSSHRIAQVVAGLMAQNVAATSALDRLYITKGIVSDLAHTHSDYVADYFRQHAAELDAHHQAVGFTSHMAGVLHNRQRARMQTSQHRNGITSIEGTR